MVPLRSLVAVGALNWVVGCTHWTISTSHSDEVEKDGDTATGGTDSPAGESDTQAPAETDTEIPPLEFTIDAVAPAYATTDGGDLVEITGGPWDVADVSVTFSGEPALVQMATSRTLTVQAPALSLEGEVELEVRSGAGSATARFVYYLAGAGLTGVLGDVTLGHTVGSYWAETPADFAAAWLVFVQPTPLAYWELFTTAIETCSLDYAGPSVVTYGPMDDGSTVVLNGGASPIEFTGSADGYLEGLPAAEDVPAETSFDLTFSPGTGGILPEFSVAAAAVTGAQVVVISPSISSSIAPTITQETTFTWVAGSADAVLLRLDYLKDGGETPSHFLGCAVEDDGAFTIPAGAWSEWESGDIVYISVARYTRPSVTLPYNDAGSEVAGLYWTLGGAFTQ